MDMSKEGEVVRYAVGDHEERPWGNWRVVDIGPTFTTKQVEVKPGHRLSLQYHYHRSEHWVIVAGSGEATVGGDTIRVEAGRHVNIPSGVQHRIHNTGDSPLVFVEVQLGDLLDENDIVRLEDDYQR